VITAGRFWVFTEVNSAPRSECGYGCLRRYVGALSLSIEQLAPNCRIVYDKFHVMQHANRAIDELRRAEFFRKGGALRGLIKGKRWLLLGRWMNLSAPKRQELSQ
jgi:transposase